MSKIIKIEVLIATPPTSKCEETIAILEELVRRYPDETRLLIFRRGVDFLPPELQLEQPEAAEGGAIREASVQMRQLINKGCAVPTVVVDGVLFSSLVVPDSEELDKRVQELIKSGG